MPFAGYKDFAQCVRKNSSKKDPEAYCATIMREVEKKEGMNTQRLVREVLDVQEAEFTKDDATGKMSARVVLIKAGRAKNPRFYQPSALQRAAKEGIYNGLRMFVNHSDKPHLKRSLSEMVSAVESTEWDPKVKPAGAIMGNVEIFDEKFYDYAQRAKKYMGVSANHRIGVQRIRENSGQVVEDVRNIPAAYSVDWVVYPSAGGEILGFAKESEGADQVEWEDITLEELKAHAPTLVSELKTEFAKESKQTDPDDDDEEEDGEEGVKLTKADIARLVKESIEEHDKETASTASKREGAQKKVREFVNKSGLPERTRNRIISQFSNATEYVEAEVKEAVEDAKEELREAGARGARITDAGPSGGKTGGTSRTVTVRESVEASFGLGKSKKATTGAAASGKES